VAEGVTRPRRSEGRRDRLPSVGNGHVAPTAPAAEAATGRDRSSPVVAGARGRRRWRARTPSQTRNFL